MKRLRNIIALVLAILTAASLLGGCAEKEEAPAGIQWPAVQPAQLHNRDLTGDWETDTAVLSFDGKEYFWLQSTDGPSMEGRYQFDGMDLYLRDRDGQVYCGFMTRDGGLRLDEYAGDFYQAVPSYVSAVVDDWIYQGGDLHLNFREDGSYLWTHRAASGTGTYRYDGEVLSLCAGEEVLETGWLDEKGCLHLDSLEGWFYTEGGVNYIPLSQEDQALLAPELEPVTQRFPMDNAAAIIQEENDRYYRIRADWTVAQSELIPSDPENKAVAVVAACFMPYSSMPSLTGTAMNQCSYILYDRYTGQAFPNVDALVDEDGVYHYTFNSRDGRVELEFTNTVTSEGPVGDCFCVLMISMNIEMPGWYDGLAFAALPAAENMDAFREETGRARLPYRSNVLLYPRERMEQSLTFSLG